MAINLELKIKTKSNDELVEHILDSDGRFIKTLIQKDIYYKFSKGLLKLRKVNEQYELIKYNRNEEKGERWSDYSLLFLNGENVEEYLQDLFEIETIVEKERKLYLYKNTRIHLDDVQNLGQFLELETVVKDITKDEAIEEFDNVVRFLNLDISSQLKMSYRDLMLK